MKIRKEFRVESSHIVRNCTSHRCSHSIHGHSAVIEVFLECDKLDNAGMVYDFGLLKGTVKQFIDSMDHCYLLCSKDNYDFRNFIKNNCDRWIELPFNPSAEMLSIYIHNYINKILSLTVTNNGEGDIKCTGVRYHETVTGWAESSQSDVDRFWKDDYDKDISYSYNVTNDWGKDLKYIMYFDKEVVNPIVEQQINFSK